MSDDYKFHIQKTINHDTISNGDIRVVSVPVKVLFEWSDKIVSDYDSETDTVIEYKSGFIMKIIPGQEFVFNDEPTIFMASALITNQSK